jgi:hypothetical protein
VTRTATVTPAAAPTATLTGTLVGSNTASLTWQTANATTVTLNGAAVALSGSTQFTISAATTYTLVATGAGGSVTRTATVTPTASAPTATLTGSLMNGTTASLAWQTTNATTVRLNTAAVAVSGTAQFAISATTTYTLVATGAGGSVTRTATVTVPVDCVMSAWSFQSATSWGACTNGQQSRTETWTRSILVQPSGGGVACGALTETRTGVQSCDSRTTSAPAAPVNLRPSVSGSKVTLSWQRAATGGAPTAYYVTIGTFAGGSNIVNNYNVGNTLRVTGYLSRGRYYARVRAGNSVGMSPYSSEISFQVGAKTRPRRPLALAGSMQQGIVVLSWATPYGDNEDSPTGYIIEAGSAPGLSNLASINVDDATTFRTTGVPAGVYYVRVKAVNEMGVSDASSEIVLAPGDGPGRPTNLQQSGEGSDVTLFWDMPTAGSLPVGYVIEAGSAPGLADLAVIQVGDVRSFSTTAPPGTYYVRVRAVGAAGIGGEASNEIIVRR